MAREVERGRKDGEGIGVGVNKGKEDWKGIDRGVVRGGRVGKA